MGAAVRRSEAPVWHSAIGRPQALGLRSAVARRAIHHFRAADSTVVRRVNRNYRVDDVLIRRSPTTDGVMDVRADAPAPVGREAPSDLEKLYVARYADLVQLGYLLTSSPEVAVDICHDAFLSAHTRWATIENPDAYLRAAVIRAAAGHHRRHARERRALARNWGSARGQHPPQEDFLLDLLAGLPFRQQAVLVLRYWGGLSEQEIATAINCRVGSVGPTRQRALARLRAELSED